MIANPYFMTVCYISLHHMLCLTPLCRSRYIISDLISPWWLLMLSGWFAYIFNPHFVSAQDDFGSACWDSDHGPLFVMLLVYCGYIHICCGLFIYHWLFRWLCVRLQYLQCVSNGDTAVLHKAIDLMLLLLKEIFVYRAYIFSSHCVSVWYDLSSLGFWSRSTVCDGSNGLLPVDMYIYALDSLYTISHFDSLVQDYSISSVFTRAILSLPLSHRFSDFV